MIFNKSKEVMKWALAFWMGVGLMSIINVWKTIQNQTLPYSWIMFFISVIFIIICAILIKMKK